MNYEWIKKDSGLPWLPLDISIPYEEMLKEAISLKNLYVSHRSSDAPGGYRHKGWKSLCIHGISKEKTNHYVTYGYKNHEETPYGWTDIIDKCPITVNWLKTFPYKNYYRVRFMLLEAGGFIAPHRDGDSKSLGPINIALSNPDECYFKMAKFGMVPMKPGIVMMLDVSNEHALVNKSLEDRYHIIIHGIPGKNFKNLVEKSYKKYV